jgi:hypothetical protein
VLLELPDGIQQDELLYSAIARGARPIRARDARDVLRAVFDATTIVAVIDLPSRLDAAGARLLCLRDRPDPGGVLLHHHTLFPFYAAVADPAAAERAAALMRGDGGAQVHGMLGVRASAISAPARLRWCTDCLASDRDRAGHGWWRRSHQLAGVLVCPLHGRPLLESARLTSSARQRLAFHDLETSIAVHDSPAADVGDPCRAANLLAIAREASALLVRRPVPPPGLDALWNERLAALRDAGFGRGDRQVDGSALRRAMEARFGAELLAVLGCPIGRPGDDDWIARMSRRPRGAMHPLYHALFAVLVGRSLIGDGEVMEPRDVAGAATPSAGARLTRPDRERTADGDARLIKLVARPEMSLRRIAAELLMDPLTVKRRAHLLGVWRDGWKLDARVLPGSRATRNAAARLEDARRRWLAAGFASTDPRREAMREAEPAAFALLYRRDREWLEANSPAARAVTGTALRVDWAARDAEIEARIAAAVPVVTGCGRSARPIRPATLARAADVLALVQRHAGVMPRTAAALVRHSEDGAELARRRLDREVDRLAAAGAPAPARTVLARAAGIGPTRLSQLGREIDDAVRRAAGACG